MRTARLLLITLFSVSFVSLATAQPQEAPHPPSLIENLLLSVLPIILIAVFIWLVFLRNVRKMQHGLREERKEYDRRVIELLERIAKALEEKGRPDT